MNAKKILTTIVLLIFLILVVNTAILPGLTVDKKEAGVEEKSPGKGKKILDKVIAAVGGAEKLAKVKNYAIDLTNIRVMDTGMLRVDSLIVIQFPDKFLIKVWAQRGEVIVAVDGDKGWVKNPPKDMEIRPMSGLNVKVQRTTLLREIFFICKNPHLYNIRFVGEKDWYKRRVLDLKFTGPAEFHLFIDPETYLPAGCSFFDKLLTDPKPLHQEELYYDYKEINGIKLLHRSVSKVDGRVVVEYTVNKAKINMPVGKDFFKGKGNYVHLSDGKKAAIQ